MRVGLPEPRGRRACRPADELFRAGLVQDYAALHRGGDRKSDAAGMLAFIRPVMTSAEGRWVAMTRCMPAARPIWATRQMLSSTSLEAAIIRSASSSITTTRWAVSSSPAVLAVLVIARIGRARCLGKEAVALEHLHHGPLERAGGLFGVRDHRDIQVRDAVIDAQLHHLGVDHDELDFLRRGLVEQADYQRVHAHGFAGAGGAGDEQMGQLGDVAHDAVAADVLAQGEGHLDLCVFELGRVDDVPDTRG
jgi:hypothetical protein